MYHHQGAELRPKGRRVREEKASGGSSGEDRSSPSGQGVLDGVGERMAQVQGACHVWGGDAHHEDAPWIRC